MYVYFFTIECKVVAPPADVAGLMPPVKLHKGWGRCCVTVTTLDSWRVEVNQLTVKFSCNPSSTIEAVRSHWVHWTKMSRAPTYASTTT